MKRVDFKKHSSVFYIGKGLIIASIVITASLGFLLGFFVGKQVRPLTDTHSTGIVPLKVSQQTPQETAVKELLQQQPERANLSAPEQKDQPQSSGGPKTKQAQAAKPTQGSPETKDAGIAQDKLQSPKTALTRKYTVQIGAFKNPGEADALRTKMSKKGYKIFVTVAKTNKQETLHKVMVGEYKTRKEADVLSIKLKNSEGLRTFVTFIMQEGATRQH